MKIKINIFLIYFLGTSSCVAMIFFMSFNNAVKNSMTSYFLLLLARYFGLIAGTLAVIVAAILRILKRNNYINKTAYIFAGAFNLSLGILSIIYFLLFGNSLVFLHEFLLNLLLGVIITADIFFI